MTAGRRMQDMTVKRVITGDQRIRRLTFLGARWNFELTSRWLFLWFSKGENSQGHQTQGASASRLHMNVPKEQTLLPGGLCTSAPELAPLRHLPPPLSVANVSPFKPTYIFLPSSWGIKTFTNSRTVPRLPFPPGAAARGLDFMPQDRVCFSCYQWPNKPFLLKRHSAMVVKIFVLQSLWMMHWSKLAIFS